MKWLIGIGTCMAAGVAIAPLTARQDVALKDLMPKGTLIGVAINQRQSDGVDTAAVDIITKQFNQISPENLLKFQPVHPAAGPIRLRGAGPLRRSSASTAGCRSSATPSCGTSRRRRGSFRERTARPPIARRSSRACATTSTPSSDATRARSTAGTSSTRRSTRTARCARRRGATASATTTSPRRSSSRARPTRTPSSITTTTTSRSRPSALV